MSSVGKRVLLLAPPNPFLENPRALPRLGLLYLGARLEEAGHDVTVRHLASLSDLVDLADQVWDFVGISATTREYPDAIGILNYMKREQPTAAVALGGSHATALPEEALRNGFDLVVTGEADDVIAALVARDPGPPEIVNGGWVADLDTLPFPDRRLIESDSWRPYLGRGVDAATSVASIVLSRGCPFHCRFCGPHFGYRRRSASNIGAELRLLASQACGGFVILDDLPFVTERQVREFCEIAGPLRMRFRANFRADHLTPAMARLLADAGCTRLQFGIESASQLVLDAAGKETTPEANGRAIQICHDNGLEAKAMFIWGLPGDGVGTAEAMVAWVARYRPDSIQVARFVPLPASPLWLDGYHRRAADYGALAFFGTAGGCRLGVGNDLLSREELDTLAHGIVARCADYTRIDRGMPASAVEGSPAAGDLPAAQVAPVSASAGDGGGLP